MSSKSFYPLLRRQLNQIGFDLDALPPFITPEQFFKFIEKVNASYEDFSKRLKTLERSMAASSDDLNGYIKRLKATEEDLKRSDEAKTRFFQNVSHELRTPLTLMLHPLDEEHTRDPQNKNVSIALKNSKRMLRLVNQLLDFQKITAGTEVLELGTIDLRLLVETCTEMVLPHIQKKSISLSVEFKPDLTVFPIRAQQDGVEKSFFNYLSNAIKYTPVGGSIKLICENRDDKKTYFRVIDTGPGVPKEKQSALFQIFSQVHQHDGFTGTGIGLAYVKELIEKMQGEVGVISEVGVGSEFWFSLRQGAADDVVNGSHRASVSAYSQLISIEGSVPDTIHAQEASNGVTSKRGDGHRVLVVDDLHELRLMIADILQKEGFVVDMASSAEAALDMIGQSLPDLIITDWMLPRMSGPELIRKLREEQRWSNIPIVLLTAKGEHSSRLEGLSAGATAYIGKPFDKIELLSAVRNLLKLKTQEKQIAQLNTHLTEKVLKRYLSPDLVNQILKGEFNLEDKVKVEMITVVFCDICDFTSLSEELGPHKISTLLNQFLDTMTEVIFKYGGTIDKFMGDGIMTIFGAPEPIPPQEQVFRAKSCALEMRSKLNELNNSWSDQLELKVSMRIGIHQGPAIVGNFGGPRRKDYTAIGPTVNIAARVESCSQPGEIYFTGVVRDFLPDDCWVKAGRFRLKGIESEVVLFKLRDDEMTDVKPLLKSA